MFLTKKFIPRRTFLRGAGTTLALPLLDAMLPAQTPLSQTAASPLDKTKTRFMGIFVPHGMAPGYWEPEGETGFTMPTVWEPLEPYRDYTTIMTGMWSQSAEPPPGVTGADHWVASAYLCGEKPKKTTGADIDNGTTIDQIIAQRIGQETLLPSLELGLEDSGANSSNCGEGYSCAYTNSISWNSPYSPNPMEINPQVVFERLFGNGATPEQRAQRRDRNASILDSIYESLARFKSDIDPGDRVRLDEYTENIREIERRLEVARKASGEVNTDGVTLPAGVPESFDEHIRLQFDLTALAFRGDITRVTTMLYARDLTTRAYPASGVQGAFHGLSHHAEDPRVIADYAILNQYHVKCLSYFLETLAKTPDGEGTLLDNSLILYGTNMGNSNQHLHYDVPHVLVGGASGRLKGGRHLAYPSKTVPTGNLLLSMLHLFGIEQESIGDSTGPLPGLV